MSETKAGLLINHIVDAFPDGGEIAGYPVQVIDGPGALDIRNTVLFVGYSFYTPSYSATGFQEWAAVGRVPPSRKEQIEVNCSLRVGIGNKDMRGCRARAIAIFEAIAFALRGTVQGWTANGEFQQIQMSRYELYQERTNDGVSVTLEFAITAMARV
jgi:hypothetical protein